MLVWRIEQGSVGGNDERGVRLSLFDANSLPTIAAPEDVINAMGKASPFHVAGGEIATAFLSTALDDGEHHVELPGALQRLGELLILAESTAGGRMPATSDRPNLRLWILDTATGRLEIVPQDWYNTGPYDFGYQWVTRMARLPSTGDIVGEGIRLGIFRLDPTRRRIADWPVQHVFYMPEG